MAAAGVPQSVSRDKDQDITPERGDRKGARPLQKNKGLAAAKRSLPTAGGQYPRRRR